MSIFHKITTLFAQKQSIEKEISIIQKSCNHHQKSVKQIWKRVDSSSPVVRYVCNECLMVLGYPDQQDMKKFFRE